MFPIYRLHEMAFSNVSAYVIARDGKPLATIAFKFPRDGAGRLYAYVHWKGLEMVRAFAGGYGYDKCSAAAAAAGRKLHDAHAPEMEPDGPLEAFWLALREGDGSSCWDSALRARGFDVWQAV